MVNALQLEATPLLFCLLPYELILKVLDNLDFCALVACTQVCTHLRSIVSDTLALQYTIELGVSGMEDGPSRGPSVGDRLDRLLKYQKAWYSLEWTGDKTIAMTRGYIWELAGGVLAQTTLNKRSLIFTQLPSTLKDIQEEKWTVDISTFDVRDFTMDRSQDLLVLVERARELPHVPGINSQHSVRLLNISTGAPHASAAAPELLCDLAMGDAVNLVIQVCGDCVAVLFKSSQERKCALYVWNWKTGHVQFAISGVGVRAFAFLTERRIIVATHVDLQSGDLQPNLVIYDITQGSDELVPLEGSSYLCTFMLPAPGEWTSRLDIEIQSDPSPSHVPHVALSVPFFTKRDHRIHVVTVFMTDGGEIRSFAFFIPSWTLFEHLSLLPAGQKRHILWERWGPTGSRMMSSPAHSNVWVCHVYGMRYVTPDDIGDTGATSISVYDFNPLPIKRKNVAGGVSREGHITEAIEIDTDGIFKDVVTTSLPYRLSKVGWGSEEGTTDFGLFGTVMCSEDSLIVVGTGFPGHRHFRVLSF